MFKDACNNELNKDSIIQKLTLLGFNGRKNKTYIGKRIHKEKKRRLKIWESLYGKINEVEFYSKKINPLEFHSKVHKRLIEKQQKE